MDLSLKKKIDLFEEKPINFLDSKFNHFLITTPLKYL